MQMKLGKKIIVLILFAILVIGLVVGGYLLYKNNNTNQDTNMTVAEARELVKTACEDLGWYTELETEQQSSNIINVNISTLSLDYEDLNSDNGYEAYRSSLFNENEDTIKANFLVVRMAFENSDIQEGVFYSSTASRDGTEYTLLLYFTISQNSLCVSIKSGNGMMDYFLTKDSEDSWTLNGYSNFLMNSEGLTYGTNNVYSKYVAKCISSEVIQYTEHNVCLSSEVESYQDINLTNILRLQIHDCNFSNYKIYRYTYYSTSGIGESGITSAEIVNSAKSTFNSYKSITRQSFENRTFTESNYLEQLYIYLGYITEA